MSSLHLSSITFEHHPSGFGISHARPRISWKISTNDSAKGAVKNWLQESYEISILRAGDVDPTIYNTESSESVLVPWPGRALQSREEAHVKIRAHGRSKNESGDTTAVSTAWSSPATVETALLAKEEWEAKLTSSTLAIHDAKIEHSTPPVLFGKTFTLPTDMGALVKARLYITAQGVYQALLNGQRVGDEEMAPGWTSYKHRLLYQTFDVKSLLVQDKVNAFSVEVAEGWYAGRLGWIGINRCVYGSQVSFLAQLEVEFERGNFKVVSDNTWKSKKSAITRAEIYDGEDYDAREEFNGPNGDMQLDHDAWTAVEELAFPSGRVVPADLPPVRVIEAIDPVKVFKTKSGKVIMDFGQNLVGKLQVRLPAPTTDAAQTISFNHAEVMEHGELGTRPLRSAKPIDKVTLSAKQPTIWSPKFTFHGFRYAEIEGWPSDDGLPPAGSITALVLHSAMTRTGWFSCSDPLVNQLHQNVLWSMKGNFFSIPTDCPQRDERLGWTGDIQVFCPSANFLFDTASFLESWLQDVLDEQLEEGKGGIPGLVVPSCLDGPRPKGQPQAVWHDVTVLTPWDLYNSYGDINLLRKQYPSMKAWVDQGIARGSNGLWNQNNWNFGDWLDPSAPPNAPAAGRTDSVLVADAYLVRVLDTLAKISTLLGETEDAARYKQDATETRNAFQHEYVAPSGLIAGDTQTGYAMAICFGLLSSHEQIAKAASRLAHLIFAAKFRIATGFAGTPIITHALSEAGNDQLAYRMLLEQGCPSWLYPISMGATTIWERWDSMLQDGSINPGSMTSFNHYALGAVANWLHKSVGGISPLEPGWQKVLVKPVPGGTITSAEAAYDSPYGRISCSWKIVSSDDGDTFDAVVIVPPNTSAQVVLPGIHAGGEDQHEVGSGEYHFSCPYKLPGWPPKSEFARSVYYRE